MNEGTVIGREEVGAMHVFIKSLGKCDVTGSLTNESTPK